MNITSCKVNHYENPLGFAMDKCVFSWVVENAEGKEQNSARIRVRTGENVVADTGWSQLDSLATEVPLELLPETRYIWTVSVRTDLGEEAVSEENRFETGLHAWQASWIGCDAAEPRHPIFSRDIAPRENVVRARLYICGLGLYEARWNGEKIGGEYLTPYCNNYNKWVQYQTFDVTEQLQNPGTLCVELGNGWYKGRFGFDDQTGKSYYGDGWKLIAELHLTYLDGSTQIICTDEHWTVSRSNIFFSNIYDGEQRDDTLPHLPDVSAIRTEAPKGKLTPRHSVPVKNWKVLPVQTLLQTPAGETVLDVGQNMSGIFRLAVHESAGTKIHLQFGEILQNGNFYRENLRTAKAEYIYISDGQPHVLEPKFTFYGFRYVKVQGVSNLRQEDFTAMVLHSELPGAGTLVTGNPLVNQLISNAQWGQLGNFLDVPTDCPQRDERMGWTGDAQVFARTACYQRDCYAFYAKYLNDLASEQEDGAVPIVVPSFGYKENSAAWSDAACILPWTLYEMYGDRSILERQYASMTAWVDYITRLETKAHGWLRHFHYGDWLALDGPDGTDGMRGGTENAFIAASYYRRSAELTAKAAAVLGKTEDAEKYQNLADAVLKQIQDEYFTPNGRCAITTQTGYLLAYQDNLNPNHTRAGEEFLNKMQSCGNTIQTGFVGTPMLCPALTKTGQDEMAFELLLNEGYPGWLYAVKMGATTIWERWNSVLPDGSVSGTGMNSLNHYSYGSIVEWIYQDVAGISPLQPGFRKVRLAPHMHKNLKHLELRFASAAGTWKVHWQIQDNGEIFYECTVPFGCSANLELPYGGKHMELNPGEYSFTYKPDRPLHVCYSSYTKLETLLKNPTTRALLLGLMPQLKQLPASMQERSFRQFSEQMGGRITSEQLDRIDSLLAQVH